MKIEQIEFLTETKNTKDLAELITNIYNKVQELIEAFNSLHPVEESKQLDASAFQLKVLQTPDKDISPVEVGEKEVKTVPFATIINKYGAGSFLYVDDGQFKTTEDRDMFFSEIMKSIDKEEEPIKTQEITYSVGEITFSNTTTGKGQLYLEENMSYEGVKEVGEPAGLYDIEPKPQESWEKEFDEQFLTDFDMEIVDWAVDNPSHEEIKSFIHNLLKDTISKHNARILNEFQRQGQDERPHLIPAIEIATKETLKS